MTEETQKRMPLGRIVITEGDRTLLNPEDLGRALESHAGGFWGGCDASCSGTVST